MHVAKVAVLGWACGDSRSVNRSSLVTATTPMKHPKEIDAPNHFGCGKTIPSLSKKTQHGTVSPTMPASSCLSTRKRLLRADAACRRLCVASTSPSSRATSFHGTRLASPQTDADGAKGESDDFWSVFIALAEDEARRIACWPRLKPRVRSTRTSTTAHPNV